jgi:hypothetical protein
MSDVAFLRSWAGRGAAVTAVAVGAGALTLLPGAAPTATAAGLEPWADCDALLAHYRDELVQTATPYGVGSAGGFVGDVAVAVGAGRAEAATPLAAAAGDSATGGAVGVGPTGTNVQEQGVDEPDTVKALDGLLFVSANGRLQVLEGGPQPRLLSSLALGEQAFGAELLVDGDRVLALVNGWRAAEPAASEPGSTAIASDAMIAPAGDPTATAVLVDIGDPSAPRVLESLELEGRYVSARLVDGTVRLVTSSAPQVFGVSPAEPYGAAQEQQALERNRDEASTATLEQVLPDAVRRDGDGAVVESGTAIDCRDVQHASSGAQGASTLVVTTLRLADGLGALDRTGVTTDGDLVYASTDRLYVATSRWGTVAPATTSRGADGEVTTQLHAFDTSAPDRTLYVGSGSVPGYVYGRWALSAHEGHLRVATTLQPPWDGGAQSSSSVAVLAERDGALAEVGRVDGLGVDERIYAVRYFGDVATVVTFRQTDPLYVLDLADPTAPRVLGELKIPGFSTYLHPIGDDRLLGVGQDADALGRVTGMQLSVFDLSDLSRPAQVDRLSLGDGWSPALDDSRALGYDPGRRLAVLPFLTSDERSSSSAALGVRVTPDFRLEEAGRVVGPPEAPVERVVLVDGLVHAVTPQGLRTADAGTWEPTGSVAFAT